MLGGLFSNKSTAAVFVDYEHWYYGYKNIFAMRPNVEEWYKELKEEYNVNEVCMMTGFKSRTHFSRLFKEKYGY